MPKHRPRGGSLVKCNLLGDTYLMVMSFESNSTSAPDGVAPSAGFTVARADIGDITITFDEAVKPKNVLWASCEVAENDANDFAKCGDYVPSTGVLPVYLYTNSNGTISSTDSDDQTYKVLMVCNDSKLSD